MCVILIHINKMLKLKYFLLPSFIYQLKKKLPNCKLQPKIRSITPGRASLILETFAAHSIEELMNILVSRYCRLRPKDLFSLS